MIQLSHSPRFACCAVGVPASGGQRGGGSVPLPHLGGHGDEVRVGHDGGAAVPPHGGAVPRRVRPLPAGHRQTERE